MPAFATAEGTARYHERHPSEKGHAKLALGLTLSTLGYGSYLGEESDAADRAYTDAFLHGLRHGVNVLDTAANYRGRRSERVVGAALQASGLAREEVLVATKGGFVPHESGSPLPPSEQFRNTFIESGVVEPGELVAGCHVLGGAYVRHELGRSLENLKLDAVDVYFLHNPETQLESGVPWATFEARLRDSFEALEEARREGRVAAYGLATWNGLRRPPGQPGHLPLERILDLARDVGGPRHGLRALELPYNLAMHEAATTPTQPWKGRDVPALRLAQEAGLLVLGSATLLQGRLLGRMPPEAREALGVADDLLAAIQLSRSTPGMTSALVGTGRVEHAEANLAVRRHAARPEAVERLFAKAADG